MEKAMTKRLNIVAWILDIAVMLALLYLVEWLFVPVLAVVVASYLLHRYVAKMNLQIAAAAIAIRSYTLGAIEHIASMPLRNNAESVLHAIADERFEQNRNRAAVSALNKVIVDSATEAVDALK